MGTFFSGGVDSSIVTSFASEIKKNLRSFAIGFEDKQYDESYYAEKISKSLNVNLTLTKMNKNQIVDIIPKINDIYDEPFSDPSQIPTYFLSQLVNKCGLKVVLTGDGGDELFGGYNRYFLMKKLQILKFVPIKLRKILFKIFTKVPINYWNALDKIFRNSFFINAKIPNFSIKVVKFLSILNFDKEEEIFEKILETSSLTDVLKKECLSQNNNFKKLENFEKIEDFMMFFDTVNYLPGDILVKVDRSTMSNSLEARAPFLDHKLFSKAWKLPTKFKIHKNSGKLILKDILSKKIDSKYIKRPKMGFGVPLDDIIRIDLKEWSIDKLESKHLKEIEILDDKKIQQLKDNFFVKKIGSHISIWNILILSDWLNKNA